MSPSSVAAGWRRVAAGANLVASALADRSSQEASAAAQRLARHGLDLSARATTAAVTQGHQQQQRRPRPSGDSLPEALAAAAAVLSSAAGTRLFDAVVRAAAGSASAATTSMESRTDRHSDSRRASEEDGRTAPYESQLRRKLGQQQQQQQQRHGASPQGRGAAAPGPSPSDVDGLAERPGGGRTEGSATLSTAASPLPNPYLFHQRSAPPSTTVNGTTQSAAAPDLSVSEPLPPPRLETMAVSEEGPIDGGGAATVVVDDETETPVPPEDLRHEDRHIREGQAVPSSRIGRAWGFASLGAGLAWGIVGGWMTSSSSTTGGSAVASDANADRLAATLCRMRGAALKMGQMLSIQDEALLPPALARALAQVRQGADAMPNYQLVRQLESQWGSDWRDRFESFDERPFAAASIGQVHRATIRDKVSGAIQDVAVKVQYPGVAQSIESDLGNLAMLVKLTGLAPKGLFIDNVIRVGRDELKVECNYLNEMANQEAFQALVGNDPVLRANKFAVPAVFGDLTTEQIITTAYAPGGTIDKVTHLDQDERNRIGRAILYLTMQELFEWRLMQTDPNWGNFLYDVGTQTTTLIDFGATREYPKSFVDGYLRIVWASANKDGETLMAQSRMMGFLTGEENDAMLDAHRLSGFTVGEPFYRGDEPFDFRGSRISSRMSEHTSVFLRHRLTPPPEEVYTLHRKLAGAYMLCIKLGAVVPCRDMLEEVVSNHQFDDGMPHPIAQLGRLERPT